MGLSTAQDLDAHIMWALQMFTRKTNMAAWHAIPQSSILQSWSVHVEQEGEEKQHDKHKKDV